MNTLKIGNNGIDVIKQFEGFRSKPYLCPAKVPTIGYGATYYPGGKKVTMTDSAINESKAIEILSNMMESYENAVNKYCTSAINQNQFDALVSFTYNLGAGNLKSSTLLKKVNLNPNDPTIKTEFMKWTKAGGKVLTGLVRRRTAESELYFKNI